MMPRLGAGALLISLLAVAGCSTATESTGSSEANQTEAKTLEVVKGREYAKCWFDLVGTQAQLSCTSTARGGDPLAVHVYAVVAGANGFRTDLDIEAGGTVIAGSVDANTFPREVEIFAYLSYDARRSIGAAEGSWNAYANVASPAALSSATPLSINQPFDLWPVVTLVGLTRGGGFSLKTAPYTIDMQPFRAGFAGGPNMELEPSLAHFDKKVFYIVAPPGGGPLAATQHLDAVNGEDYTKQTSLPGPGYYTVTDDGLRIATAEELAKAFPTTEPVDPPVVTDPPIVVDPPTEPTAPTAPVDTDPSCGGAQQSACGRGADRSCDSGTKAINNTCYACGAANQQTCYVDPKGMSSAQGVKCDPSTKAINGTCYSCGTNGQTACYADPNGASSSQGLKCDAGTKAINGTCYSCGANAQTACYADPNGASPTQGLRCNEGLRVVNGTCYPQ